MARMFIKSVSAILMAAMMLTFLVPHGEAAIGCGTVIQYLGSCVPYLTSSAPLGSCCSGVKGLYGLANTTPDRQSVCGCLKTLAGTYSVDLKKAGGLPGQCGVSIPYKISPNIDCSTVH